MSAEGPTPFESNEVLPPGYLNDRGWTREREKKLDEITKIIDQDRYAKREHTKETLRALRELVDETEAAVRN